jgi:acyl carrier protein
MNDIPRHEVLAIIYQCLSDFNQMQPPELRLECSEETNLLGRAGALDSLGVVNLFAAIETKLQERFGRVVTLAGENTQEGSASWHNVGTLADYLSENVNS